MHRLIWISRVFGLNTDLHVAIEKGTDGLSLPLTTNHTLNTLSGDHPELTTTTTSHIHILKCRDQTQEPVQNKSKNNARGIFLANPPLEETEC